MVRSVQTVHLSCADTNIISKWTKMRFHTTLITYEFCQVRLKLFMSLGYVQCKPCTYLASRLALFPNGPNKAPLDPPHLGVPSGASKTVYEPMVRLTQTEHLSCTDTNTIPKTNRNEIPHDPRHLGVPLGASNTISKSMVRSMETMHQSYIKSSTISKCIELSFHLSLIT
jgi:hypothetical protein